MWDTWVDDSGAEFTMWDARDDNSRAEFTMCDARPDNSGAELTTDASSPDDSEALFTTAARRGTNYRAQFTTPLSRPADCRVQLSSAVSSLGNCRMQSTTASRWPDANAGHFVLADGGMFGRRRNLAVSQGDNRKLARYEVSGLLAPIEIRPEGTAEAIVLSGRTNIMVALPATLWLANFQRVAPRLRAARATKISNPFAPFRPACLPY